MRGGSEISRDRRPAELSSLLASIPTIAIADNCTHFGDVYALNRFLAMLLIRGLEEPGLLPRRAGVWVPEIEPSNSDAHLCDSTNDPAGCYDYPHIARFQAATCCENTLENSSSETFDTIVIRAGTEPPAGVMAEFTGGEERLLESPGAGRQALPYYLLQT